MFTYNAIGLAYEGNEKMVRVPHEIDGQPVRYLQPGCFKGSSVEQVILPETLVEISSDAFKHCEQLLSIELPKSITHIGGAAFQGCHALTSLTIPASVRDIGGYAFDECTSLSSIQFEGAVEYIGAYAFSDTALKHVVLPEGISQLGNSMFFNCQQLQSVKLPNTTVTIAACAFAGCTSLTEMTLPSTVRSILDGAFEYCLSLSSITFGSIPRFIDENAFHDCPNLRVVKAPIAADDWIEVYDEKRHIFENDAAQLLHYTGEFTPFKSLFRSTESVSFVTNEGPDYRLQMKQAVSTWDEARQLFSTKQFEAVIGLLKYSEQPDELELLAKSYAATNCVAAALQAYAAYSYLRDVTDDNLVAIGSLLLANTTVVASDDDLRSVGRTYLESLH